MIIQRIFIIIITIAFFEFLALILIKSLRKKFQWLITPMDEEPILDKEGLKKFIAHGFDPELGWIRKANTWHYENGKHGQTTYHIDNIGSRCNPGHEQLKPLISFYGDSFSFCRQVNDSETIQWYLSERTNAGTLNFSVGNYGVDQAMLRMEREIKRTKTDVVILGVVPSTIVRILCMWKHYNEFGNTFGFKPRFYIKNGKLVLLPNIINSEEKIYNYKRYLKEIQKNDYFYKSKFQKEMIRFPYLFSLLKNPLRNLSIISALIISEILRFFHIRNEAPKEYALMKIMQINKILRYKLFQDKYATDILYALIERFVELSKEKKFTPVFLFMPQKDDLLFIKKRGPYYDHFIDKVKKKLYAIDMTEHLLDADNLNEIYSDNNVYGGHFSKEGNELVSDVVYQNLKEWNLI